MKFNNLQLLIICLISEQYLHLCSLQSLIITYALFCIRILITNKNDKNTCYRWVIKKTFSETEWDMK
ncbi:hypothetical protein CDQ83_01745 [Clostridium thermosuccinogenes]|nr:hypothetical protein CDQ83_01745 [Pseudoclostridium thermosuccinogenes]